MDTILEETQKKFPHIDHRKLKILFDGWRAQGLRRKQHSHTHYTTVWRRGWMSPKEILSVNISD